MISDRSVPWSARLPRNELSKISEYCCAFIFPLTRCKWPVPSHEMQPHTCKLPPPCFTFFLTFLGKNSSPDRRLQYWRPSEPNKLNLDSSENQTGVQSSTDHPVCSSAHK